MPVDNAGNSLSNATLLAVSPGRYQTSVVDRIDISDPFDYYKLQISGRSSFNISLTELTGNLHVRLLDASGVPLEGSFNSGRAVELFSSILRAGTYYLQITGDNSSVSSDYRLSLDMLSQPKTDLTWHHAQGLAVRFQYNGVNFEAGHSVTPTIDPIWQLTTGDFNGDDQTDYFWRHQGTGQNGLWLGDQGDIKPFFLDTIDLNWHIDAIADLNQDNCDDVIWRHTNGTIVAFYMNGAQIVGSALLPTVADTTWTIGASGDFNNDNQTDLVWRNTVSGANRIWFMNGGNFAGWQSIYSIDPTWSMVGASDFNNDTQADIIWRHQNGTNLVFYMSAGQIIGSQSLGTIDPSWRLAGVTQRFESVSPIERLDNTSSTAFNLGNFSDFDTLATNSMMLRDRVDAQDADDYYRFTLDQTKELSFSLNGLTADANLQLLRGSGTSIVTVATSNNSLTNPELIQQILQPGIYYIQVTGGVTPSAYTLNVAGASPKIQKYNFTYFYNGVNNTADYYTGWVYAEQGSRYNLNQWVDFRTTNNQSEINGRYLITSASLEATATAAQLGKVYIDRYYDQDDASKTNHIPLKFSANQASGSNYLGSEIDSIGSSAVGLGDALNLNDFGQDFYEFDLWEAPIAQVQQANAAALGTATSGYAVAATSPFGTKGIVVSYSAGGTIHWSNKTGARAILPTIESLYRSIGGSGGFLGFATNNQFNWGRGVRQDFEGGYIYHDGQTSRAFKADELPIVRYNFTYFYNGANNTADHYIGWVYGDEGRYSLNQLVDPNAANNESGANGKYQIMGISYHGNSKDVGGDRGKVYVNQYINRETNETLAPLNASQVMGTNYLGSESGFIDVANNADFDFGRDAWEFDRMIRINTPNGGQSLSAGSTQLISWADTINENVKIDLYQGTTFVSTIANNIASNGSFNWQIASNLGGSDYRIRITSMTNAGILDSSDAGFTIAGLPSVRVTSPNPIGQALTAGKSHTITWTDNFSENVRIELYKGNNLQQVIANSVASNGSYTWDLANTLAYGTDYRIRISHITNATVNDFSDNFFTIDRPFNIQFDYRFDTNGWFTADRRAVLEAAAAIWEKIILDDFVDTPIGTQLWNVRNPQTGLTVDWTSDLLIDDLLIFVGARDLGASTLALGGSSGYLTGDSRYEGNDFEPQSGTIAFNSIMNWFADPTPTTDNDVPFDKYDLLSTAIHEIGHILGFNRWTNAYSRWIVNDTFTGPNAQLYNGGRPIPLAVGSTSHIRDDYAYNGSGETAMDPTSMAGDRVRPTVLDLAILDDIGYSVDYTAAFQNPVLFRDSVAGVAATVMQCGCEACMAELSYAGQGSLSQLVLGNPVA